MRPGHVGLASNRVNAMANKTLRTTAKVAKKTAPMRVAAKAARQPTHTDEADADGYRDGYAEASRESLGYEGNNEEGAGWSTGS